MRRNRTNRNEPLRSEPDYTEQNHKGTKSHLAADSFYRVYFVDENYQNLTVSTSGIIEGGDPLRFRGQLPFIPRQNEFILTENKSRAFRVMDVEYELNLSPSIPPRIYIILKEEHVDEEIKG